MKGVAGIGALPLLPGLSGCANQLYDDLSGSIPSGVSGDVGHVIVIGAGVAGLTAARALQDMGKTVTILEGRSRIGGRIVTQDVSGVQVDMGAAWIHGTQGNPVARYTSDHGIGRDRADIVNPLISGYDSQLGPLSGSEVGLEFVSAYSQFIGALGSLRQRLGPNASITDGAQLHLDDLGLTGDARRLRDYTIQIGMNELLYAGPSSTTSLAWWWEDQEFEGGDWFPQGGYTGLVDSLAGGLDIRLNEVVSEVEHDAGGVRVTTQSGIWDGTHVVVTIPLGVLQAGSVTFTPELPPVKQAVIGALDMGNLERVVMRFDDAFWLDAGSATMLFSNADVMGEFPLFFDLSRFVGSPTLSCFCGGQFARDAQDNLDEATVQARVLEILSLLSGGPIPQPNHVEHSHWRGDPFSLGSYSYIPVGGSPFHQDLLADPVDGRLLFAGEATFSGYSGTVHGAMLSGIREAKRLLGVSQVLLT